MVADRVILVCTIIVAAVYLYATTLIPSLEIGDPLGPKAFPRLLGAGLIIAAGLLGLEMWKDRKTAAPAPLQPATDNSHYWVIAAVSVWTAAYYFVFDRMGYVLATAVYLFALMMWFARNRLVANGLTAVLFSILSYAMFVKLDVNLPKGWLPF